VFRYVSGKIAVKNPNNVTVKLPTSTLGFRGTIVGGSIGADGQGLVGLLGPGDNNDAGAQTGSFTIEGLGGETEDVDRTGFGVQIGGGGDLSDAFQLSEDQVNGLTGGLGGGVQGGGGGDDQDGGDDQGGGLGGGTDMGGLSGENDALAGQNTAFTEGLNNLSDNLFDDSVKVAQDKLDTSSETSTSKTTTLAELASITEGSYFYSVSGSFTQSLQDGSAVSHAGTFSASWYADFVSQEINNILVAIDTTSGGGNIDTVADFDGDVSLIAVPFSEGSNGQAVFSTVDDGGSITATIMLKNSGSDIAHTGEIVVSYDNGEGGNDLGSGSGSATALPPPT
jgi:hypothetical protein